MAGILVTCVNSDESAQPVLRTACSTCGHYVIWLRRTGWGRAYSSSCANSHYIDGAAIMARRVGRGYSRVTLCNSQFGVASEALLRLRTSTFQQVSTFNATFTCSTTNDDRLKYAILFVSQGSNKSPGRAPTRRESAFLFKSVSSSDTSVGEIRGDRRRSVSTL